MTLACFLAGVGLLLAGAYLHMASSRAVRNARARRLTKQEAADGRPPDAPGPPVRVTSAFIGSFVARLMFADAKDKHGCPIPPVNMTSYKRRSAIEWAGHVIYCDPSRDQGTPEYALRYEGVAKCITNLVRLHASAGGSPEDLPTKIMEYLDKSEVLVVPQQVP